MTAEVGLGPGRPADGLNFGDIDNDGYLDIYSGDRPAVLRMT